MDVNAYFAYNKETVKEEQMTGIIEWDEDGYPTESSLQRLREALKAESYKQAIEAFYQEEEANPMTKTEKQRTSECRQERCKDFRFCEVKWGRKCSRLGGKKIPRIRKPQEEIPVIVTAIDSDIRVRKNPWRAAFANDI